VVAGQYLPIEEMEVFRRVVAVADWGWETVGRWKPLAADTIGKQLVRALASVGANMVEGDGRGSDPDAARFFVIARASAREARYWIERATSRALISRPEADHQTAELTTAMQQLNALIRYRRRIPTPNP